MGCLLFHLLTWPLQGPFYVLIWKNSALPFAPSSAITGIISHWLVLRILTGEGNGETLRDDMMVCEFNSALGAIRSSRCESCHSYRYSLGLHLFERPIQRLFLHVAQVVYTFTRRILGFCFRNARGISSPSFYS